VQRALMRANPATLTATGVVGRLERLRDVWLPDTLAAWFRLFWGRGWMVPSRPDTNLWLISPRTATPSFPPPPPPVPTPWHPPAGLLSHARAPYLYTLHTYTPLPHMVTPLSTGNLLLYYIASTQSRVWHPTNPRRQRDVTDDNGSNKNLCRSIWKTAAAAKHKQVAPLRVRHTSRIGPGGTCRLTLVHRKGQTDAQRCASREKKEAPPSEKTHRPPRSSQNAVQWRRAAGWDL